jgi:hypothetical protein
VKKAEQNHILINKTGMAVCTHSLGKLKLKKGSFYISSVADAASNCIISTFAVSTPVPFLQCLHDSCLTSK